MLRILTLITGLALMGACTQTQVYEEPESLGEFKLRVNYAFADKAVKGPVSRDATPEEWTAAIEATEGVRLDSSDLEAQNPATGEVMRIGGADGDVALFDPESEEWYKKVFSFYKGHSSFDAPRDWDTNQNSPLRRAACAIASQLGAKLVGEEGEEYS